MRVLKPRILVIGDVCTELTVTTDSLPEVNGKAEAEILDHMPGGRANASSVAFARLGADTVLCSSMGDDTYGRELCEYLISEKVDTRFTPKKRGESTAIDIVIKEMNGSERKISYGGALEKFSEGDVEEAFISYPDAVLLHGSVSERVIDEAVKQAANQKLPLFIASLPDPSKYPLSRIGQCEVLVSDEDSVVKYTGIRPADQERCMRACMALSQRVRAKHVILRLGERGSFLYDGTFYSFISSYDVPQMKGVDSNDAFVSALVLEYLRSEGDIKRACDFATIVSAVYLSRGGGLRAYPYHEDVKRFILRNDIDFNTEE